MSIKLIRATTVPESLKAFFSGLPKELEKDGFDVIGLSSPGIALKEFGENEQIRTISVPMERHISLLNDFKSLFKMWCIFRKEKPNIVHSNSAKAGLLCMIAAWLARVPIRIHTFTGLVFPIATGFKRHILMATDWLTCACATNIIPEGKGVKNDLMDYKITKKPLRVLGNGNIRGIDLEYYNPELFPKNKDHNVFTFVNIGRIVGDKGINELIEAFIRLNSDYPQTRLVIVGPEEPHLDPIRSDTKAIIEKHPDINAVGLQKDVRPFYAYADALVFPSYREGFPNVVIEAGAMGLPSIVTDINGSREIIIEGENGTIVPSKDAQALYQAMKRFVENPDDVKRMAANARPLIASRYEQSYVRQCLKDFYKECLASSHGQNKQQIQQI